MQIALHRHAPATTRTQPLSLQQALLLSGIAYAVLSVVADDVVAAAIYPGYDRTSQAISELSATGAPSRGFLTALTPLFLLLIVAFGVGVWRAAGDNRALRVTGAVVIAHGLTMPVWLLFPMTSREEMVAGVTAANDVGHIALTVATVSLILLQLGFGAAALGGWFRRYSVASAVTIIVFGAATGVEAAKLDDGDPTPWMGVLERVNIGAWLLWLGVLATVCLARPIRHGHGHVHALDA